MIAGLSGIAAGAFLAGARSVHAGPLNPPGGPVGSTGRTTQEIFDAVNGVSGSVASGSNEARRGWIPVGPSTTPGSGNALYVINQPGYYYLTGPVSVAAPAHSYGIRFDAGQITLDLNGHAVTASGVGCAGIGAPSAVTGRRIRNGVVYINGGAVGIQGPGFGSVIEDLIFDAQSGARTGIDFVSNRDALIRRCRFLGVSGYAAVEGSFGDNVMLEDVIIDGFTGFAFGVRLRNTATLRRCIVRAFGTTGIGTGEGAVIEDCVVGPGGGAGIVVSDRSTISDCTVDRTGGIGISAGSQSVVQRCRSTTNVAGGISVVTSCLVQGCFVDFHPNSPQFGIQSLGNATQVVDNVIGRCFIGIDFRGVSGCVAMRNLGRSNTNNISISGGGNWYPFVDFGTLNTATNPFANLFT